MKKHFTLIIFMLSLAFATFAQKSETTSWRVKGYTETTAKTYLDNNSYLDDIEGIWQSSDGFKYAIEKDVENQWAGSSVVIGSKYLATNFHVVDGAHSLLVSGVNGNTNVDYEAEVLCVDKYNDLAIIKITDPDFKGFGVPKYGLKTATADVGTDIFVLGYPLTTTMGKEIKLTTGVISSKTGFQGDVSLYQISAPVQPGNSGGPLFDGDGNLIGIVNAKHEGAENVGYAIDASAIDFSSTTAYSEIYKDVTVSRGGATNIKILAVETTEEYTAVYMSCTNKQYERGWYSIEKDTYIRDEKTGRRYAILNTDNCAFPPLRSTIAKNTTANFVLYFPAISKDCREIDLIESDSSTWKFYGVKFK